MSINKGRAYQMVMSKLKTSSEIDDVFHLIGLIASCESIISDRLSAFLGGTKNEEYQKIQAKKSFESFGKLLELCQSELEKEIKPINGRENLETKNLYAELFAWKAKRNQIIHSVCKSSSPEFHITEKQLFAEAQCACINGHRLLRLLLKWSKQSKAKNKKIK